MEQMVNFYKGLADNTRIRIFFLLIHYSALSVGDIEKILKVSQTNISRHLTIMRHGGLVTNRRSGNYMLYQLGSAVSPKFIEEFKRMAAEHIQFQSDLRTAYEYMPPDRSDN